MAVVDATFRCPWSIARQPPRAAPFTVALLLPAVAGVAGSFGRTAIWLVVVVAVGAYVQRLAASGTELLVSPTAVTLRSGPDVVPGGELVPGSIVDVTPLDVGTTTSVLEASRHADVPVDLRPFLAHPTTPTGDPAQIAAVVTTSGRGSTRSSTLVPVWEPEQARPLLDALVAASPHLDRDDLRPDAPASGRRSLPWRSAIRQVGARPLAVLVAPALVVALVWLISLAARAATLDPLLGRPVGTLVIACFRLLELTALVSACAAVLVAVTALFAWTRIGEPISGVAALRLGALRSVWALWQLRIWLLGTAALLASTGAPGRRTALAYAAVAIAWPGAQAVRELLRRTVEEARRPLPPPMTRVHRTYQWIAVIAAVAAYTFWRIL